MTVTPPITLVLGATGNIGGQVAELLLAISSPVRLGVRTPQNAAALASSGCEVVPFDFESPNTWEAALDGVQRVFVVAPGIEGFAELVVAFVNAALAAGVKQIVKLSAFGVSEDAPFGLGRQHARADAAIAASGIDFTILRPLFFMDNFSTYHGHTITAQGAFYGASAGQATAYVSTADIAAVAVEALTSPAAHSGQIYELTGGEALTDAAVAELIGARLGRTVNYIDLSEEQLAASMTEAGVPALSIKTIVALERMKSTGKADRVSSNVQQILDRAPETLEAFLTRTQQFTPTEAELT